MHDIEQLEGIASWIHDESGLDDPPVDALDLAVACGLRVRPWRHPQGALQGDLIRYDATLPPRPQQAVFAHELAHWALQTSALHDDEASAVYLSHALLLPRRRFDRDLRSTWNPIELQGIHANAPASWIVRRIAHLRPVVSTIVEDLRVVERIAPPALPARVRSRLTMHEVSLVAEALHTGAAAGGRLARGWAAPVHAPARRVVVVAEAAGLRRAA